MSQLGTNKNFLSALNETFDEKFGDKVITLAEQFRAEERAEGKHEVVANMQKENFEPETIKKITRFKIVDIKKIAKDLERSIKH